MAHAPPACVRRTLPLVLAVATVGCAAQRAAQPAPAGTAPAAAEHASLLEADDALSAALATRPPAEAFRALLAEDVAFAVPGADQARSREAALALLAPLSATRTTLHRMGGAASQDGRLGYTFGWFLRTAASGAATTYGKYLAAWRAEAGGWRVDAMQLRVAKREPAPAPDGGAAAGYRGAPAPGDAAALARAALDADARFAALSKAQGYSVAFERFADPRAVCFTNGDFQWGMGGVRDVFGQWAPEEELVWSPTAGRAAGSGDLAWTTGLSTMSVGTGAAASRSYSNYLTIWARQPDGSWKWLLDAGDSRPPPR